MKHRERTMDSENVVPLDLHWQNRCMKNDKKRIIANHANVMIALRSDPAVRDVFAYDEMLRATVMTHKIGLIDTLDRWVTEADVGELLQWLQQNGFPSVRLEVVRFAMNARAHENAFHPVYDYLDGLVWDGVPRLATWLAVYLGAELGQYTENIGRMFLTSMVARIAEPGCQADHMPVLEGPQGILKSSACRVLGGRWFSDGLPDITAGKEASQHLRDKWVVEVSEMHAMNRAEAALLKSFISRTVERYRPSYGRLEVHEPRQCVFVGTTNMETYLRDPTGGRRFWPVRTGVSGRIELDALERDRDLLFAEAVVNYRETGRWWPDHQVEQELIKPEQAARYAGDVLWEDKVEQYCSPLTRITVSELATHCLGFVAKDMRQEHALRITAILRSMGWEPKRAAGTGARYWVRA